MSDPIKKEQRAGAESRDGERKRNPKGCQSMIQLWVGNRSIVA